MDAVALAAAKAYAKRTFAALSQVSSDTADFPAIGFETLFHFDASILAGADASAVGYWADSGPKGLDVYQDVSANRPTLHAAGLNGKNYVGLPAGKYLARSTSNEQRGFIYPFAGYNQPLTYFAVARVKSGTYGTDRVILGHNNTTLGLGIVGAAGFGASPMVAHNTKCYGSDIGDDTWHVIAAVADTTSTAIWVDGYLVGTLSTTSGANPALGVGIGAMSDGTKTFDGDLAEGFCIAARLGHARVADISAALAAKWGLSAQMARQATNPAYVSPTLSTTDATRVFLPRGAAAGVVSTTTPMIIWAHPAAQTEIINLGYFMYPLIHAAVNKGWIFAAPHCHGDNWGNASGLADVVAMATYLNTNYSTGPIILAGGSMGALLAALTLAAGTVSNVKGFAAIDGVFDLTTMYSNATYTTAIDTAYGITRGTLSGATIVGATSLPTTASFPTIGTQLLVGNGTANVETVTTTGASSGTAVAVTAFTKSHSSADQVSDYPTKTAGHDPMKMAAVAFGTTPQRYYASSADVTVTKSTNTDAMQAKVAATALESAIVTHVGGHLENGASRPADFVAFVARCLAA